MCITCLAAMCINCTGLAEFLILTPGTRVRACRAHVDGLRHTVTRITGFRPTVIAIGPTHPVTKES